MIKEAEDQVNIVHDQLKVAQSRQKSYYDHHHRQEATIWMRRLTFGLLL